MEKTLKTLKDLYYYNGKVDREELKQEAIKWYKDLEAEQPYGKATKCVMLWITIFFDLTDKDIKSS